MEKRIDFDEKLWFEHQGCEGKHYFIGNPHLVPGRMWAYCPKEEQTFFLSKPEIGACSLESHYWMKGFLAGNEPEPPQDEELLIDFESEAYKKWQAQAADFRESGVWKDE